MPVDAVEGALAGLAQLKHRLETEGRHPQLAAEVRRQLDALPAEAPPVCHAFGAELLRRAEAPAGPPPAFEVAAGDRPRPGEELIDLDSGSLDAHRARLNLGWIAPAYDAEVRAVAALGRRLPLRNPPLSAPGHVTPPVEAHGLVHGGTVQARGFRLVVKAYRFFESISATELLLDLRTTEVVAGVCEQMADDGRLLARWSTAERLASWYASTSVALPAQPAVRSGDRLHGFYRPAYLPLLLPHRPDNPEAVDSGLPEPLFYTGKVLRQKQMSLTLASPFGQAPTPGQALENALFIAGSRPPSAGGPGFVIDTPYVAVFSLGPDSPSVIVTLPRVFRQATLVREKSGMRISQFERRAGWEARLFSL